MSTFVENATVRLTEAAESLRRAEDRFYAYVQGTSTLLAIVKYQDLKDEVTACREVLAGAQRNYDSAHKTLQETLAAQNRINLTLKSEQKITSHQYTQPINPPPMNSSTSTSSQNVTQSASDNGSISFRGNPRICDFAWEDFNLKNVLGFGRATVYYEENNQIALKTIDLFKQLHMVHELLHEIRIYGLLSDLQGKIIPKLVLHGYWEGGMYCAGFSICGTVPKTLSESQKQSVLSIIDTIHSRGIIHNSISVGNILVDDNGKVYLIDFGLAYESTCKDDQEEERNLFKNCLDSLCEST
ncbi:Serine/threonine-protein kinase pkn5 [Globomyces sp. JEL0801]|nr:Serine/threonine-protein kinase pkn5 [Globomyces sp. JEL0801]